MYEMKEKPSDSLNIKTILWLDDYRNPYDPKYYNQRVFSDMDVKVIWVKSYDEFVSWVQQNGLPDGINFDHDLSEIEEWLPVVGYEDKYQVSNYGNVKRSLIREDGGDDLLTPIKTKTSLLVNLKKMGNNHYVGVHTLVLCAFDGQHPTLKEVNHLDGNRWNNHRDNLDWGTPNDNIKYSEFFVPEYREKTGMEAAKWLVEYCMDNKQPLPMWRSQSANEVGKENINKYLINYFRVESRRGEWTN